MLTFSSFNLLAKINSRSNPYGVRDTVEQTPEVLPVTRVVLGREMDCTGGAASRVQKLAFGRRWGSEGVRRKEKMQDVVMGMLGDRLLPCTSNRKLFF